MIKIYHNSRCRKSREGLALLEASGKAFEVINDIENVPSKNELKKILQLLGITPLELVRKNEAIWKENFRGKSLTDDEVLTAMVQYPKLIERPIVLNGNEAVIGRPKELISKLLQ